jgi:hypothetical protein
MQGGPRTSGHTIIVFEAMQKCQGPLDRFSRGLKSSGTFDDIDGGRSVAILHVHQSGMIWVFRQLKFDAQKLRCTWRRIAIPKYFTSFYRIVS